MIFLQGGQKIYDCILLLSLNRPFPSCHKPKCGAIYMKIVFYSHANKTNFHNKSFALSLVLKVRVFGTRKWPIKRGWLIHLLMPFFRLSRTWLTKILPKLYATRFWIIGHFQIIATTETFIMTPARKELHICPWSRKMVTLFLRPRR